MDDATAEITGPPQAASELAAGAPPSNTAPANSTNLLARILMTGIDSLYGSYQGTLKDAWEVRLSSCKDAAQSDEPTQRLQAQVDIAGHLFLVHDKGAGRFAYVVSDNWFRIALAKSKSKSLPVAYVQISSECLLLEGVTRVLSELAGIINTLAEVRSGPHASRADLRGDFMTMLLLSSFEIADWVGRAQDVAKRYVNGKCSGWEFGLSGAIAARLYDKTLELERKPRPYLLEIWRALGWDGTSDVCRLEFQLMRDALVQLEVDTIEDLLAKLPSLWLYCTTSWLRLKIPNASDGTRSRWPDHPLWSELSAAWEKSQGVVPARRCRRERTPTEDHYFLQGLGGITGFMASRGITSLDAGLPAFVAEAREFHSTRKVSLKGYVKEKVLEKGRRYGTIKTRIKTAVDRLEDAEIKKAYQRASKGG